MRVFLTVVLPLLLPTALYVLWLVTTRRGPPSLRNAAWPWMLSLGVILMLLTFTTWGLLEREEPGGTYVPPVVRDGVIVPGHVERLP